MFYAIYAEGDYIWFGGIEGEFTRYDIRTDTYTYYPIDCIGDIKPGKGGSLLIAGCSGLAVFDKKSGDTQWHQTFWRHLSALSCPLPDGSPHPAIPGWLQTGEGLIRVGPDGKEVHAYTVDDNLVSNSINSLLGG